MIKTVISHDVANAVAEIRFEHGGVVYQDKFDLRLVIPGSERIFGELGMPFDRAVQQKVIMKLTDLVTSQINSGAIKNVPSEMDGSVAPPDAVEDTQHPLPFEEMTDGVAVNGDDQPLAG